VVRLAAYGAGVALVEAEPLNKVLMEACRQDRRSLAPDVFGCPE